MRIASSAVVKVPGVDKYVLSLIYISSFTPRKVWQNATNDRAFVLCHWGLEIVKLFVPVHEQMLNTNYHTFIGMYSMHGIPWTNPNKV